MLFDMLCCVHVPLGRRALQTKLNEVHKSKCCACILSQLYDLQYVVCTHVRQLFTSCTPSLPSCIIKACMSSRLCQQVVPSDDFEEADNDDSASPSLLNDELRQEMRSRQAKMHRLPPLPPKLAMQ